jgi:hypothetical protein
VSATSPGPAPHARRPARWQHALPWLVTGVCFAWLYSRVDAAAAREGQSALPYLLHVFAGVSWWKWLAVMVPYSAFFFLIDSLVVWRVVNWFNTPVRYADILPIRGSSYILSIVNEQVGKGAMGFYLFRRDGVPGWQVGSSMVFIMFCEFFYLTTWATLGVLLRWDHFPEVFHAIPAIAVGAAIFFAAWVAYFRGRLAPGSTLRDREVFHAFRRASPRHYLTIIALRSPAILAAVFVYHATLSLFGVQAELLDLLGYLPVIFFGAATPGPMRSVAIVLWVTLFPEHPGAMAAFGFVQHNFFIFFNAAIGLLFLRRANAELFGDGAGAKAAAGGGTPAS